MNIFLVAFAEEFPNAITALEMPLMSSLQWALWRSYFYWGNYKPWTCQKQTHTTFHFPLFLITLSLLPVSSESKHTAETLSTPK